MDTQRGSGARGRVPEPQFLAVGQVVGAHGITGELRVQILSDDPDRFARLQRVFIGPTEEDPVPFRLEGARLHNGRVLLRLEGCQDRSAAEEFCGSLVFVPLEEAIPLEEGEYFEHQIVGLEVWTTAGEFLGEIVDILYTGANEVYVVDTPGQGREILIPAIDDVVRKVDLEAGRLVIDLIEGLV